ncbi:MAG: alkaline phosphatase family protein [Thermoanaerobaculia bacterium]
MPIRWGYLKRFLAGAIFGLYMAHLLFFLNPQVEMTPLRLAIFTIVFGLTCGLLFGSILWGFRALRVRLFGRPVNYHSNGFGFVVLAAFIATAIYWIHLEYVRIYLPIGAVRMLAKATNVITFTAFVLLGLWVMERNADRRRSRTIFVIGVALIAISAFFLYQRRESYRTERRQVVVATIGEVGAKRPVMLVAIRNLPHDWILTMRGEGRLPHFEAAAKRGYFARLEPFPTTSPKSLWASLATGKLPYRHLVTGRFSYRTPLNPRDPFLMLPSGVFFQAWGLIPPVDRISAQLPSGAALPLWGAFERLQVGATVVNWQAVRPGDASRVVTASSLLRTPRRPDVEDHFAAAGAGRERLAQALVTDRAAVAAVAGSDRQALSVVALEGFSEAQKVLHVASNELPPASEPRGATLRTYAQELDEMLARLRRNYPDHLLVVCSPSAVVLPEMPSTVFAILARALSQEPPGADHGFVLVEGDGTAPRENAAAAFVVDIVPTVLFAAGLPVGRDMDGRIITEAFDDAFLRSTSVSAIQTYEAERLVVRRAAP